MKNNNRSLFLYTSLIFIVAILMILLAFFGQNNMNHKPDLPDATQATTNGSISERASALSEENLILHEKNKELTGKNVSLTEENNQLAAQAEIYQAQQDNNNKLLDIYNLLYNGKYTDANGIIDGINPDTLTEKQKIFFDILLTKTKR